MRLVILESPFHGDEAANVAYARRCLRDCLMRGESPIASHLLMTQDGVLDDTDSDQRGLGITAGHAWMKVADAVVVYEDRGISDGMAAGIREALALGKQVEYRRIEYAATRRATGRGVVAGVLGR